MSAVVQDRKGAWRVPAGYVNLRQAAAFLACDYQRLRAWIQRGILPQPTPYGGRCRVLPIAVLEQLKVQMTAAKANKKRLERGWWRPEMARVEPAPAPPALTPTQARAERRRTAVKPPRKLAVQEQPAGRRPHPYETFAERFERLKRQEEPHGPEA